MYLAWAILCAAAFAWLFSMPASDDYAGWMLVAAGLALPSYLALRSAPIGAQLGLGRTLALAIPAGIVLGGPLLAFAGLLLSWPDADALAPWIGLLLAPALTLVGVGVVVASVVRRLRRVAHPVAARRVLWIAALVGVPGAVAIPVAALRGDDPLATGVALALAIMAALPLAWSVPLLAALPQAK